MPSKKFKWLSEIERIVRGKVDQKRGDPGETWDREEFAAALTAVCGEVHERISSQDDNTFITFATVPVVAGQQYTDLPTDIRVLKNVFEPDANGRPVRPINLGESHELGFGGDCNYDALFRPYPEGDLYWTSNTGAPSNLTSILVVYEPAPPTLIHSCIVSSGSTIAVLEPWTTIQDDSFNGIETMISEGNGMGGQQTITNSVGADQSIQVAAWGNGTPNNTSFITSRPNLPADAEDCVVYGCSVRMLDKVRDEKWENYERKYQYHLNRLSTVVRTLERRYPDSTIDDYVSGHGDAANF